MKKMFIIVQCTCNNNATTLNLTKIQCLSIYNQHWKERTVSRHQQELNPTNEELVKN